MSSSIVSKPRSKKPKAPKQQKLVNPSSEQTKAKRGKTDWKRVHTTTDDQIEQWALEEDFNADEALLRVRVVVPQGVVPQTDVRALREYLGLTREEFSLRYHLSPRTVQQWEQHAREPDGPAKVLLWLITKDPSTVAQQLASLTPALS
jgi:DNA-binding transcriptional regulator YiaG